MLGSDEAVPGQTRHWQEKLKGKKAKSARTVYTVGTASLSRQGVDGIYRRVALSAFDQGLVKMSIAKLEEAARALSSHSLRVGLTRDLFAAGEDGAGIAQALRWSSPSNTLRYERKLPPEAMLLHPCCQNSEADNRLAWAVLWHGQRSRQLPREPRQEGVRQRRSDNREVPIRVPPGRTVVACRGCLITAPNRSYQRGTCLALTSRSSDSDPTTDRWLDNATAP